MKYLYIQSVIFCRLDYITNQCCIGLTNFMLAHMSQELHQAQTRSKTKSKLHVTVGILLYVLRILTSISGSNKPKVVEGGLRRPPMTDLLWFSLACQGRIRDCSRQIRFLQGIMKFGATHLCFFVNATVLDFLAFSEMTCFQLNMLET